MLLFLSHSGADTAAAVALRARILAAPAAREAGLDVWLDVEELRPGEPWRPQLEAALQRCTAFAVLLGSQGIVNWVDAEVGVALDRATTGAKIPFIPIRASDDVDWDRLPPFARQFQGLTDPLGDVAALAQLIAAATGQGRAPVAVTDRPFVGLQAMGEAEADRFFGRDAEIDGLADLVRRHPVTAVVADSGAGKSSLVRAGLIPAFRGGRLADPVPGAAEKTRLAIVMRPGDNPALGLRLGVERAARDLALGPADIAALRHDIDLADADKTVFALACHQGPDKTDILLVVDQFEELLTQTGDAEAAAFVDLLLALSQPSPLRSVRIVLTVRADYFNLISAHPRLFQALTDDDGAAQLRLRQVGDDGLAEIVLRPLAMAGHGDEADQQALLAAIRRDVTDRPGDLALVQIALEATWARHRREGETLLQAYTQVKGVRGALANVAEAVRTERLTDAERALLPGLMVRLVRLGDTGGAIRRQARLDDLDPGRRALAQKLAAPEQHRLLMTTESAVEVSHEALFAQWPWLQTLLKSHSEEIRTLGRLGEQTALWEASRHAFSALPNAADRASYQALAKARPDWLARPERALLSRANVKRFLGFFGLGTALAAIMAFGVAAVFFWTAAREAEQRAAENNARAQAALGEARDNAATAFAALARVEAARGNDVGAAALALAAWPRDAASRLVRLPQALGVLSDVLPALVAKRAFGAVSAAPDDLSAKLSPDGRHLLLMDGAKMRLIRTADGREPPWFRRAVQSLDGRRLSAAFSPDNRRLVVFSRGQARAIDLRTGAVRIHREPGDLVLSETDAGRLIFRVRPTVGRRFHLIPPLHGKRLQALYDCCWDERRRRQTDRVVAHSADGHWAIMLDRRRQVAVHDVVAGRTGPRVPGRASLNWLAFHPSGERLLGVVRYGRTVQPVQVKRTGLELEMTPLIPQALEADVFVLSDAPPMVLLAGDVDGDVDLVWQAADSGGFDRFRLGERGAKTVAASLSPDKTRAVLLNADGAVRVYETDRWTEIATHRVPPGALDVTVTTDAILVALADGTLRRIAASETPAIAWRARVVDVGAIAALSPGLVPITMDGTLKVSIKRGGYTDLYDKDGNQRWSGDMGEDLFLAPDGSVLLRAAENDAGRAIVEPIDPATGTAQAPILLPDGFGRVRVLDLSRDRRLLALLAKARAVDELQIWDLANRRAVLRIDTHGLTRQTVKPIFHGAFTPDGTAILLKQAQKPLIRVDLDDPPETLDRAPTLPAGIAIRENQLRVTRAFVVAPDGRRVIGIDPDDRLAVWDLATGIRLARLGTTRLRPVGFLPGGRLAAFAGDGRLAHIDLSHIPGGDGFQVACALLTRDDLAGLLERDDGDSGSGGGLATPCGPGYAPPHPVPGAAE